MEKMAAVDLPVDVPRMAELVEDMVRKSLQAFIEADAELARAVLNMDEAVDEMNRNAYKALTKVMEEQSHLAPQALNALMISRALERVGDHATNIAEDIIFWVQGSDIRHPKSVAKLLAAQAKAAVSEEQSVTDDTAKAASTGAASAQE
jgi:phosphate transport system protein